MMSNKNFWSHSFVNALSSIWKISCLTILGTFTTSAFSATYDVTQDYGHKTIYLRGYKVAVKPGVDYKTGQPFKYEEGYLIYSETPVGATREAACLADMCNKWTSNPNSFKQYEDKKAKISTSERSTDNNNMEECIMEMKLLKK